MSTLFRTQKCVQQVHVVRGAKQYTTAFSFVLESGASALTRLYEHS